MVDITHRIGIKAPAAQVYKALTSLDGLGHWWTEEVTGDSDKVGGKIVFTFHKKTGELRGTMVMEVQELTPQKEVRWRCVDGPPEWMGTDIIYKLVHEDNQTTILFGHRNWREEVEFMSHCSMKWATFLLSLRAYVETGKGVPAPHDPPIGNWD